jgi:predicted acetyltransferase
MQVRRLTVADLDQARRLGTEAFGGPPPGSPAPAPVTELPAGRRSWGAVDDAGRLAGKVVAHAYESWWRGRRVPTAGIAGVAVSPEQRGGGLLHRLFEAATAEALEQGEVLSTLYPTAPGIYRGLGYELVTSYDTVEVPTAELGRIVVPTTVTTRRAGAADLPAVVATYDAWAAAQNGPLTRTGPLFEPADLLDEVTGVSLAVDDGGAVVGFMSWDRGSGYGPDAVLTVHDLLATSLDGYRALWLLAGSFASVTGRVRLSTSGADPARLALPSMTWDVVGRHPYALRVLDLPGAVAALAPMLPGGGAATIELGVTGDRLGLVDGGFRIELGDGTVSCEPTSTTPALSVTIQGLSLLVAGAQSCGNLRLLGLLTGPTGSDAALDAAFGGRQLHVRDYF